MEAIVRDFRTARLEPADLVMLHYAVKLTRTPAEVKRADVELMRQIGFDDRAIHDIAAVTAYFNFVNRLALGLGVELEPEWAEPEEDKWIRKKSTPVR